MSFSYYDAKQGMLTVIRLRLKTCGPCLPFSNVVHNKNKYKLRTRKTYFGIETIEKDNSGVCNSIGLASVFCQCVDILYSQYA